MYQLAALSFKYILEDPLVGNYLLIIKYLWTPTPWQAQCLALTVTDMNKTGMVSVSQRLHSVVEDGQNVNHYERAENLAKTEYKALWEHLARELTDFQQIKIDITFRREVPQNPFCWKFSSVHCTETLQSCKICIPCHLPKMI